MRTVITPNQVFITFLVVAVGFYCFVSHAWRGRKNSGRLKYFFLGGANMGSNLTEHNTLGMTFAWAGGTWFFVTVAYRYGPWVTFMQIPWLVSVVFLGANFGRILHAVRNRTIHGFLGSTYGDSVRIVASIATSIGYVLNSGFEIFWSSRLLAVAFGIPNLDLLIALVLSVVVAAYCYIGGYVANTTTDKPQNILGVLSLAATILFVVFGVGQKLPRTLIISAFIFAFVALMYTIVSYTIGRDSSRRSGRIQSALCIVAAVAACAVTATLTIAGRAAGPSVDSNVLASALPPLHLLIGVTIFQLFFNGVDMANWQQVAANGDIPVEEYRSRTWAIIRAALYLLWFPALGGALLGVAMRGVSLQLTDDNVFQAAFGMVLPNSTDLVRGFVLGLLVLGFLSTTMSTADTYAMAAVHTLTSDVLYAEKFQIAVDHEESLKDMPIPDEILQEQKLLVSRARILLIPITMGMTLSFYGLYRSLPDNVLEFQMIMYGFALSLFTPVMVGLFGRSCSDRYSSGALWGISAGIVAAFCPYLYAILSHLTPDERGIYVNLTPAFSLIVSTFVFFAAGLRPTRTPGRP